MEIKLRHLRSQAIGLETEFDAVTAQVTALSNDVHHMSHALHPSILEDFGLESALRALCEEFEQTRGIATRFVRSGSERPIPPATASMFYRIAQEALRNVAKHAGDARVTVRLYTTDQQLCLAIEDDVAGFDPSVNRGRPALGLISMQERARLLGGHVDLRSSSGGGTTINVVVPW